jgi:GNAT superfamily N-acetyltransferase
MIKIRPPKEDELELLSALCLRSKAVWGYDDAFMEACRDELTVTLDDLRSSHMKVAEDAEGILGLAQVTVDGDEADLSKLFVDPARLRTGVGRVLFDWAVETAKSLGARRMIIEADPDAAAFYRGMGAREVGSAPSGSIPGRVLPRLQLDLQP